MAAKRALRSGRTINRSVSFVPETLKLLQARADRVHHGNLSAAIADAARLLRMEEARQAIANEFDELYGPLTAEQSAAIHAEEHGLPIAKKKKTRAA